MPTETLYDRYNDAYVSHTWTEGSFYDQRFDIWSTFAPDLLDAVLTINGETYHPRFDAYGDFVAEATAPIVTALSQQGQAYAESPQTRSFTVDDGGSPLTDLYYTINGGAPIKVSAYFEGYGDEY